MHSDNKMVNVQHPSRGDQGDNKNAQRSLEAIIGVRGTKKAISIGTIS